MLYSTANEAGIGGMEKRFLFKAQPHLFGVKSERSIFLGAISPEMILYPFDGQKGVQRSYDLNEIPNPTPNQTTPTSNPVSITFSQDTYNTATGTLDFPPAPTMISFRLFYDANNTEITNTIILDKNTDPNARFSAYDFALFAKQPFDVNTTYRAEFSFVKNGTNRVKVWRFTTM
jgi:hypothetical protein